MIHRKRDSILTVEEVKRIIINEYTIIQTESSKPLLFFRLVGGGFRL